MFKVVLEGFDGAGKSILGAKLSRELGLTYHTNGGAPKDLLEAMECCAQQHNTLHIQRGIMDRLTCISNFCYSTTMSVENKIWLSYIARMTLPGTNLILCRPSSGYKPSMEDYDTQDYMEWLEANKKRIIGNYDFFVSMVLPNVPDCNFLTWDYEKDDLDLLVESLKQESEFETG